jgi:hypothetical protein
MDVSQTVGSIRKFSNFLMCLFPFLPRWWDRIRNFLLPILTQIGLVRLWQFIQSSPRWRALHSVLERFYWRDYSKDLREWEKLPALGIGLLRIIFLLTLALAVFLPVAMLWPVPGLPLPLGDGKTVMVAAWSVLLWGVSFSFAWACLLGGAAVSNRPAALAMLACFTYLFGAAATALPRSGWNGLLALGIAITAVAAQRRGAVETGRQIWRGAAFCVPAGILAGIFITVFTPLGNFLPHARLATGMTAGAGFGLVLWGVSRWLPRPSGEPDGRTGPGLIGIVLLLAAVCGLFLGMLAVRGGLSLMAGSLYPLIGLWSTYLWPVWYFIGIGVIFKLLKHARILTAGFQELLPLRYFAPLVILFVLTGTVLTWSESFTGFTFLEKFPVLLRGCADLYHRVTPWLWSRPLRALTADWLKWVFLFDLAAVIWLLARRRLNGELLASLLFKTFLAWFLIYEYLFEYFSFTRSGAHSVAVLFCIAIWMLWLTHVVGLRLSSRGSAGWPQEGRIALYGAVLLFVLLNLHARAAAGDSKVVDEVFLYLFRGIIDVGLPYFLYVYAGRRFKELPVPAGRLFAAFCAGAFWTLPLNALDRLVAAGSWRALSADLDVRLAAMYAGNPIRALPLSPEFPAIWILLRGVLAVGAVVLVAAWLQRRLKESPAKPAALIFLVMAFGTGLASFAKAQMLISPFVQSSELDAHLLAVYFAYSLPALVLGLVVTARWGTAAARWVAGILAAAAVHFPVAVLWPAREPWLRSTGLIVTLGLAGLGLFLLLVLAARRRIEAALGQDPADAPALPPLPPLIGARARWILTGLAAAGLLWMGLHQLPQGWMVPRTGIGLPGAVDIPAVWQPAASPSAGCLAAFRRRPDSLFAPELRITREPCPAGGRKALVQRLLTVMSQSMPQLAVQRVESWDGWYPGSYAVDFSYNRMLPDRSEYPGSGTVVILPGAGEEAVALTLTSGDIDGWISARWDLARIARSLRGRW